MRPALHLGAMNFGRRTPKPEAERIVARAMEAGVEWIDTANVYGDGESERIVGAALSALGGARPKLATKVGQLRVSGKKEGLGRARVIGALSESLERLRADAVDLYYLHTPDVETPIEETLDGLAELYTAGRIRAWGVSNYASWQILEMLAPAKSRGLPPPACSQVIYNLLIRQIEIEHLRFLARYSIECVVYNPLAGGLLSERYDENGPVEATHRFEKNTMYVRRYLAPRMLAFAGELRAVAKREGVPLAALAYGWIAARPGVGAILLGPATVAQLDQALAGAASPLPPERVRELDAIALANAGTDAVYARP